MGIVCYPEKVEQLMDLSSGRLEIEDPSMCGNGNGLLVELDGGCKGTVTYLHTETDLAGLEVAVKPAICDRFAKLGIVGVDSATIVLGDESAFAECPETFFGISTDEQVVDVAEALKTRFQLKTRKFSEFYDEILNADASKLNATINEYLSQLGLEPHHYVCFTDEDGVFNRVDELNVHVGFFPVGGNELFMLPIGSDGQFDVVAGYHEDKLVKVWIVLDDELLDGQRVCYSEKPFATRPPKRPMSPLGAALLTGDLAEYLAEQDRAKHKPWWRFW